MTLPTSYKVEVAFNAGVNTPSSQRIWTDVTPWLLLDPGVDIVHGRGDWRSAADANTLRATLNNSDGRFTAEAERQNFATNPSVEVDTTDWTQHSDGVTSVTWARQSGWAYDGAWSMRQTGTSGTTTLPNGLKGYIGSLVNPGGFAYPVSPGQVWTARAQCNVLTVPNGVGDPGLWAEIFYFDSGLSLLSQTNGASIFTKVPLGLQTITVTATAPASAAYMQVAFVMGTVQSSAVMDWYVDAVRVENAPAPVSPYYPGVKMGRPIRYTATLGSASTRYVGFVDEWPLDWPATVSTYATASITASSRLAWLGQGSELASIVEEQILCTTPVNVEPNGSLEVDATDWFQQSGGVSSVTWARQNGWASDGAWSMRQTGTSGTSTLPNGMKGYIGSLLGGGGFAYPVSAGQTWTASARANVLTVPNGVGDPGLFAQIFYFDAALTLLVQVNGPSAFQPVPLGSQSISVTATAPATAAWMQVGFVMGTVQSSSVMDWYIDAARVDSVAIAGPVAYYTLGEPAGATQANDSSGNNVPSLVQVGTGTAVVFGTATGPGTDGLTAATFAAGKYLAATTAVLTPNGSGYVSCFFSTSSTSGNTDYVLAYAGDPLVAHLMVKLSGNGSTGLRVAAEVQATSGSAVVSAVSTALFNDGAVHHAVALVAGGTLYLFVDGLLITSTAHASLSPFTTAFPAGMAVGGGTGPTVTGSISHVAFGAADLLAARISDQAAAGLTGFAGESVGTRLTRYASYVGLPPADLSFEAGMVPNLAHVDTTGRTAVDMMRTIEATEEGVLFDGREGPLTFHARNHRYTAVSAFTLDVSAKHIGAPPTPVLDRSALRNDVTASSTDGLVYARATNDASIADYGVARESLDLATTNPEEPFQHASWLVNQYGIPRPRIPQLTIKLANLPTALAQAVLAAGVGARLTVQSMPSQAESSSQDYFIEGYRESIGPGRHDFTFNVSQADPFDVWTVGDAVLGAITDNPIAF